MCFPKNGGEYQLRKNEGMQQYNNTNNIIESMRIGNLDESTFSLWKSELQKELPSFWESMKRF